MKFSYINYFKAMNGDDLGHSGAFGMECSDLNEAAHIANDAAQRSRDIKGIPIKVRTVIEVEWQPQEPVIIKWDMGPRYVKPKGWAHG